MKLLRIAQVDEDNPNSQSPLDKIFEIIGRKNPNDIAYKNYMTFKMGAGKTLKSILISCAVRLNAFNLPVIENLTSSDTLELQSLGDKKQALFVIIPAADDTFNYLVSMMYSQLFETLYFHAEVECPKGYYIHNSDGTMNCFQYTKEDAENFIKTHPGCKIKKGDKRVAHHVRFMLDEFANIGQIPSFEKKLATMRKYELSCTIILQNLAQLKTLYKDASEDIIGNCDSFVFLGGKSFDTLEYISKMLGKTTITVRNNSRSRGKSGSSSLSFNSTGRELLNPNEISLIKGTECIILIRGVNPFYDTKYDYTKHKNYQYTGDANSDYIYKISIDNSKKPDIEEIENEIEQDKKNEVIQEMDQVQNIKDFVQNEKIMPRNIQKRFSLEQPEETKDGYIAQSNEKNQKREMEKQKNLSTLQKGPNLKSKIENQTPSEASSSSEKTNKELDDIMIKVCGPNTVIKHSDGVTYDGEFLNGPQPDFSEQRDLSYQEIAKNENKYNNRQSPHNKSQHKNNQKNKKYNNAKQNKKTITKENTNSSFDFSSENKNNIVTPDVPNAENVTPDVVEPGYIETTDAMLGFFDDNCFNG